MFGTSYSCQSATTHMPVWTVVYFDQLLGALGTWKLGKVYFGGFRLVLFFSTFSGFWLKRRKKKQKMCFYWLLKADPHPITGGLPLPERVYNYLKEIHPWQIYHIMFKLFGFISSFFPLSHKFLVIFSFLDEKGRKWTEKAWKLYKPSGSGPVFGCQPAFKSR